jgi:hypothetical protein
VRPLHHFILRLLLWLRVARRRKGNKATLISRLAKYDQGTQLESSNSLSSQDQIRHASTGSAPGRPKIITRSTPADFLATRLPDLSQPLQENNVQIVCEELVFVSVRTDFFIL